MCIRDRQYPKSGPMEIAFAGRSNVGKSSLLNLITGRRKLARISGSPGKTRTINFYSINDDCFRIVDLPGYGYAKVSKAETQKWGQMIEEYLIERPNLIKVVQLVDIRHKPTKQDVQMYDFLKYYGLDAVSYTHLDVYKRQHYYWADSARNQYSDFVNFLASGKKTGYSYEGKQGTIDMWQFSSEGIISGINGRVDLNISYF